ncbi:MAG: hypothetical protein KDB14_25935 [Planctomycetales bacterium]|nr:hypothetical protein [Planctomycetales bacterium]
MTDSIWTFVFETLNFAALAGVLAWLFFKPVRAALQEEQARAERLQQEAVDKADKADQLLREQDAKRQSLGDELDAMRDAARAAAKLEAEQLLRDARARIEHERANLRREAVNIERSQVAKLAEAVAEATHLAVQKLLGQIGGPDLDRALLSAGCRELQQFSDGSLAGVTVESAKALSDEEQAQLRGALGDEPPQLRLAPELIAGVRISTSRGLIDASVAGLSEYARQLLVTEMDSLLSDEGPAEEHPDA